VNGAKGKTVRGYRNVGDVSFDLVFTGAEALDEGGFVAFRASAFNHSA